VPLLLLILILNQLILIAHKKVMDQKYTGNLIKSFMLEIVVLMVQLELLQQLQEEKQQEVLLQLLV
jgi:hypothetical protein